MDGWPTQEAVKRAQDSVPSVNRVAEPDLWTMLAAAGLPEVMGATEAAAELGVATGNLSKVADLPGPLYAPDHEDPKRRTSRGAGRLYSADAIRALAGSRRARAAA